MPERIKRLFRAVSTTEFVPIESFEEKKALFKKRALDTRHIKDTLKYSDALLKEIDYLGGIENICKPAWQRNNTKVWSDLQSDLFTWIVMMAVYHKQTNDNKPWSLIFYEYMLSFSSSHRASMKPSQVNDYYQLLSKFMQYVPVDLHNYAEELCHFFRTHQIDPYGCIISQHPEKNILTAALEREYYSAQNSMIKDHENLSKEELMRRYNEIIIQWSVQDEKTALLGIRKAAACIRGVQELRAGDIVLVRNTSTKDFGVRSEKVSWRYARIAGESTEDSILLNLTPNESSVTFIDCERVIPLTRRIYDEYFAVDDCMDFKQCVECCFDEAYQRIMEYCNAKRAKQYLQEQNVDKNTISLAFLHKCTVVHLKKLSTIIEILQKDIPKYIIEEVNQSVNQIIEEHIQKVNNSPIYHSFRLTFESNVDNLRKFNGERAFWQELNHFKGVCFLSLDEVKLQKKNILRGKCKREITDNWLFSIKAVMMKFLRNHGYVENAIPSDYIVIAPENISLVRQNLVLLRRILNSYKKGSDMFGLQRVLDTICSDVYTTIADFIENIDYCISHYVHISPNNLPEEGELEEMIKKNVKNETTQIQLIALLKDKTYLQNMIRMETDKEFAEGKHLEIVPVSGLALGKICRLENEHVTCLQVWDPALNGQSDSQLWEAIRKENSKQIEELLKSGVVDVNEQDQNGMTALHYACTFLNNRARLKIIEFLLDYPETEYFLTNYCGNTALHYFAHILVDEDIRSSYRDVLIKFLRLPTILHIQNNRGETALHHAILYGNPIAARYFLEFGADPNCATWLGYTALHCAVQLESIESVAITLKYNANHTETNAEGETPLDIAFKLNNTHLVRILAQLEWNEEKFEAARVCTLARNNSLSNVTNTRRWSKAVTQSVPDDILLLVQPGNDFSFEMEYSDSDERITCPEIGSPSVSSRKNSTHQKTKPRLTACSRIDAHAEVH